MIFGNKKIKTMSTRLNLQTADEFLGILIKIKAISHKKEIAELFVNVEQYKTFLELIERSISLLKSLTGKESRRPFDKNEELQTLYRLIQTLENVVVRSEKESKQESQEKFNEFFSSAKEIIDLLQALNSTFHALMMEIMDEEHEFLKRFQQTDESIIAMKGNFETQI
ncbi:hypothetical protein ISS07_01640 [Candidatus Woesearchaeota archaeon]|nr:hypothetical protein [Candidatus Woesearchaeota archaeon]